MPTSINVSRSFQPKETQNQYENVSPTKKPALNQEEERKLENTNHIVAPLQVNTSYNLASFLLLIKKFQANFLEFSYFSLNCSF